MLANGVKNWARYRLFFIELLKRDVENRYRQSIMGFLWLFLNPILLLVIYYFIFQKVFAIKFAFDAGQSFIGFVAVALWPWVALSEGLNNATVSMQKHLDLIKKIQFPKSLLVALEVSAAFIIHGLGCLLILLLLYFVLDEALHLSYLPIFLFIYLLLALFCLGLGLLLAALQVFLRDIAQLLGPMLMVWFYLSPIIYPSHYVPASVAPWLALNPISPFIHALRETLLAGQLPSLSMWELMVGLSFASLLIGFGFFQRLAPRFEDMY